MERDDLNALKTWFSEYCDSFSDDIADAVDAVREYLNEKLKNA